MSFIVTNRGHSMTDLTYLHDEISNRIAFVQNRLQDYGYAPFKFQFEVGNLKSGCAGIAQPYSNRVVISRDYLKECTETTIKETIPHEICHLYTAKYFPFAKQAHGPEFRRLMNILGLEGKTYHSMKLANEPEKKTRKKYRYVYLSEVTKKECLLTSQQHSKMIAGTAIYRHKMTGEKIIFTGIKKEI